MHFFFKKNVRWDITRKKQNEKTFPTKKIGKCPLCKENRFSHKPQPHTAKEKEEEKKGKVDGEVAEDQKEMMHEDGDAEEEEKEEETEEQEEEEEENGEESEVENEVFKDTREKYIDPEKDSEVTQTQPVYFYFCLFRFLPPIAH